MAHVISFTSARFNARAEKPNPINPIAGQSLLLWLREELMRAQYRVTEPDTEDWGWYIDVEATGASYLIGASGEAGEVGSTVEWTIQIHKNRSVMDKVLGRNNLAADDALCTAINRLVQADSRNTDVSITRD